MEIVKRVAKTEFIFIAVWFIQLYTNYKYKRMYDITIHNKSIAYVYVIPDNVFTLSAIERVFIHHHHNISNIHIIFNQVPDYS